MTVIDLKTGSEICLTDGMFLKCAIGNFDGVHLGHSRLLSEAAEKEPGITHSAVWTFKEHPGVCRGNGTAKILTSLSQKLDLFRQHGIELAVLADFDEVRDMEPDVFAERVLLRECHIKKLVCGFNFHFGINASGSVSGLSRVLASEDASLITVPPVTVDGEIVSSSHIRALIESGELAAANNLLGHPFEVRLPVTEGLKLGRRIGVPTINQVFPEFYAIPRFGVYACLCDISGKEYPAVSDVGIRPSVSGGAHEVRCETHIIGYSGWLYGETVPVKFCRFLRPEMKFDSLPELTDAIHGDIREALRFFGKAPETT